MKPRGELRFAGHYEHLCHLAQTQGDGDSIFVDGGSAIHNELYCISSRHAG